VFREVAQKLSLEVKSKPPHSKGGGDFLMWCLFKSGKVERVREGVSKKRKVVKIEINKT
jgi:hypothetical protein